MMENSSTKWRNVEDPKIEIGENALRAEKIPGGTSQDFSYRPDIVQAGGRSGANVKYMMGPPNTAMKGAGEAQGIRRAFVTNQAGQVIKDITPERTKIIIPGKGEAGKINPSPREDQQILKRLFG
jgi:hypothetical protein